MIKFKTLLSCILFLPVLFFEGFADLSIKAQDRISPLKDGQSYIKCMEIKNNRIDRFASDNKFTILTESTGNIRLINNPDHSQNWNIQLGSNLESVPYLQTSNIILLSYTKENKSAERQTSIRQINLLTGIINWVTYLSPSERFSPIQDTDTENITFLSDKLNIRQIDSKTGKILWSINLKDKLKKYTSSKDSLYILTTGDRLLKISRKDGSIKSETKLKAKNISTISFITDSLFLGDIKGVLYKLSDNSKIETKLFRTGGEIAFVESFGDDLLVVSNDNFLYYYSTEKEKILWKKRLSGRVISEPVIHQDFVFVTTLTEPVIYILDRVDGALINRIDLGENYVIRKIKVNESSVEILTTTGLLKFGVICQS